MTEMSLQSTTYSTDDQKWLHNPADSLRDVVTTALDLSKFTANTHYPNGFIRSGMLLGRIVPTDPWTCGPYDDTATDGRQALVGLLAFSVPVSNPTAKVNATMVVRGSIHTLWLPIMPDAAAKLDMLGAITWLNP